MGHELSNSVSRKRDAVRPKSGESVDHSDPGLMEPSIPPTADRNSAARVEGQGAILRPASHQPKNGRELEGGALIGGAAAVPLTSLVDKRLIVTSGESGSEDRSSGVDARTLEKFADFVDTHDKRGRKKGCGAWTVRGTSFQAKTQKFIRLNCKCWECRYCGPRRVRRSKRAIAEWAKRLRLNRFVTLTLDPKKLSGEDSTKYLNRTFAKLRTLLHRKYGKGLSYIRVLEYQRNGTAHFHLLLNRFIDIDWLRAKWEAVGGGWNVWIKMVQIRRVAAYVSKYLSKDLLMSAPKGSRRVSTSRDIHLFEKPKGDAVWTLVRASIERLRTGFETVIAETHCEKEGSLSSFTVLASVA